MRLKQRDQGEIRVRLEGAGLPRKLVLRFRDFISIRETEGWPLLAAALLALGWANSPWAAGYVDFWSRDILVEVGRLAFHETPRHLVNDLLLPVFFFILGLDLKHELAVGELSTWKRAAMPVFIGVGGMLVPVALYLALNPAGPVSRGWGVPIATDVAFTLAVLMMLGRRIPVALKVLTIAFAAVDDVGGVVAIALFYTRELAPGYLVATLALFGVVVLLRALRIRATVLYGLAVFGLLFAMYHSGVHTTIAGVALGLLVPARPLIRREDFVSRLDKLHARVKELQEEIRRLAEREASREELAELEELRNEEEALLGQMETLVRGTEAAVARLLRSFNPWASYIVLPLFALANAGIPVSPALLADTLAHPGGRGVLLGLLVGKPVGIVGAALLGRKLGLASLPTGIGWHHLVGMGLLAGMGFTVSLFIAGLAFGDPAALLPAKTAVMLASLVAGVAGYLFLRLTCRG